MSNSPSRWNTPARIAIPSRISSGVLWLYIRRRKLLPVRSARNTGPGLYFTPASTAFSSAAQVSAPSDGWIAARLSSGARDSFSQPLFAHTSPVYVRAGLDGPERAEAARWFDQSIERSLEWVRARGKYYSDDQRREIVNLFREGQKVYKAMLK